MPLNSKRIIEIATKLRLPVMYQTGQFIEDGGLMGYGVNYGDLYRRAAIYVDKIIKGARPADLPVELPMRFISDLALKNRLPVMCEARQYVDAGCVMSYATDDLEVFRRVAIYVDKILKGAKPGDLPVEQPTKFELLINLNVAKQIGLTIPPNVLARADRVIR
jgi:ABC-type uncharacterized transport system substrate-binding protein